MPASAEHFQVPRVVDAVAELFDAEEHLVVGGEETLQILRCSGVDRLVALSITDPSLSTVPLSRSATHSFSAQISASARVASC